MNDTDRPPLGRLAYEQIEMLLDRVDQDCWPMIAAFQVDRTAAAKRPLPLTKTPMALLSVIKSYASMLFKREADQYGQFFTNRNYAPWLEALERRVISRVFRTIAALERTNGSATLAYHELTDDEIRQGLGEVLFQIRSSYIWRDSGPVVRLEPEKATVSPVATDAVPKPTDRPALRDSYRAAFPDAGIMDICWAAKQHYREWTRWLKGELKDGSKPDRAFRSVLRSGKDAKQLRRETRPKDWK